jgi:hypothetical protein
MKILLPAQSIIKLRPHWTPETLEKLVGCDGMDKSPFSSTPASGKPLYDMDRVMACEQTDAFRKFQERRNRSLSLKNPTNKAKKSQK